MKQFTGVGVALITPFKSSGEVDYQALTRLLQHVTTNGVDYLVVMGTTAEAATMSCSEREAVLKYCIDFNKEQLPIVYGIGGNNTAQVIDDIHSTNLHGVSAILSVTPYYNKPNQHGLFAHFAAVTEASPLPIILYNVPGRTGVNMSAETTLSLAHTYTKKIVAIKEASANLSQIAYILRDRPENFSLISGDDNTAMVTIAMGAEGVISVSANAFTEKFSRMIHATINGSISEAASLNLELHQATDLLFVEGNPVGVKAALALKNIVDNNLRLPLVTATEQLMTQLSEQIKKYNL